MSETPEQFSTVASRRRPLVLQIIRFPIKAVLFVILGISMLLRRHSRFSVVLLLLLIVAGAGLYYFSPVLFPSTSALSTATSGPALTSVQGSLPSPQAPVEYFRAQQAGDANAIWNLLSDSVKQGASVQALQTQLNQLKPQLGSIQQITYVGGVHEQDGDSVYLYLLTVSRGGQMSQFTYLFTLDPQGKILKLQ
ncbi:MAG: DUF3887 domain-containing protein [Chloroflexi bacterium]|nr:DUF3887 domain-containing protein [Chloroflexota bacterium]